MYSDAHCHLSDPRLFSQWEQVIARSQAAGVTRWVLGGVEPGEWDSQRVLRQRLGASVVLCFGLHPWWVSHQRQETLHEALALLEKEGPKAGALGEMGLDFHHAPQETFVLQRQAFEAQLLMAKRLQKPIVLHIVKAHPEALELLEANAPVPKGMVHSFSASREVAEHYLRLGLTLSVSGVVCRPGYRALKAALPYLPSDRLVVETDAPDQAPHGGLHEPTSLIAIAAAVARIRNENTNDLLTVSTKNVTKLFPL